MTSARVAAMKARRELEFLEICQGYQERLEQAKEAVRRASGDDAALQEARARMKAAGREVFEFRRWARTAGKPPEGVPGRDATIRIGGAIDGMER